MSVKWRQALLLSCLLGAAPASFGAEKSGSVEPYLDEIRTHLKEGEKPSASDPEPFIRGQREKLKSKGAPEESGSYIESLKQADPSLKGPGEKGPSFIESEKAKLPEKPAGGAIQAVRDGKSDLKFRREGKISRAAGVRIGAGMNYDITASSTVAAKNFHDLYGNGFTPDVTLFYEFQPFHSEFWGNFGLFTSFGVGYFSGMGTFGVSGLVNPGTGQPYAGGGLSRTKFQFFMVPATLALDYRFNLTQIIRPFVMAGGSVVGYTELRNDNVKAKTGYSKGLVFGGGAAFLLDWISRSNTWDLYTEHGIQHFYLTVEYNRMVPISSDVNFGVSGVSAGLTFEF